MQLSGQLLWPAAVAGHMHRAKSCTTMCSTLTFWPDDRSRQGAIWNKVPCRVRNWEVQVNFKVSGTTKDLFGDGFALWYVRDRMAMGPVFGSTDHFSGKRRNIKNK